MRPGRSTMIGHSRHWREFIESLIQYRVKFIVVGAHALAALGKPRHTGDLDVLIQPAKQNVSRLVEALEHFQVAVTDDIYELATPGKMVVLGNEPHKIEILSSISGVTFAQAWKDRLKGRVGGRIVSFLGRQTFVTNKRAAAKALPARRAKDLADIALLEEE